MTLLNVKILTYLKQRVVTTRMILLNQFLMPQYPAERKQLLEIFLKILQYLYVNWFMVDENRV